MEKFEKTLESLCEKHGIVMDEAVINPLTSLAKFVGDYVHTSGGAMAKHGFYVEIADRGAMQKTIQTIFPGEDITGPMVYAYVNTIPHDDPRLSQKGFTKYLMREKNIKLFEPLAGKYKDMFQIKDTGQVRFGNKPVRGFYGNTENKKAVVLMGYNLRETLKSEIGSTTNYPYRIYNFSRFLEIPQGTLGESLVLDEAVGQMTMTQAQDVLSRMQTNPTSVTPDDWQKALVVLMLASTKQQSRPQQKEKPSPLYPSNKLEVNPKDFIDIFKTVLKEPRRSASAVVMDAKTQKPITGDAGGFWNKASAIGRLAGAALGLAGKGAAGMRSQFGGYATSK